MAECLKKAGLSVSLAQRSSQVLSVLDPEMAMPVQKELEKNGIALHLGNPVKEFRAHGNGVAALLTDGNCVEADFAVVATGVQPEVDLARDAGLTIGHGGGITVDSRMRTSDPRIFAIGDAVEIPHVVTGKPTVMAFAGPATKQARVVAEVIHGRDAEYKGSVNTFILRTFDLAVGSTGCSEKQLQWEQIPHRACHVHPSSHASYFPAASAISIKLLFSPDGGRVLGAQVVGREGVDKRLDVFATAVTAKLSVFDLEGIDYAYAPPFGGAKDPVNVAAFVAANLLRGDVTESHWRQLAESFDPGREQVIDVRTLAEFGKGSVPGAVNIPVDELRGRLGEVPRDRTVHVHCGVGLRSYIAARILQQNGFEVRNLSGGFMTYKNSGTAARFAASSKT